MPVHMATARGAAVSLSPSLCLSCSSSGAPAIINRTNIYGLYFGELYKLLYTEWRFLLESARYGRTWLHVFWRLCSRKANEPTLLGVTGVLQCKIDTHHAHVLTHVQSTNYTPYCAWFLSWLHHFMAKYIFKKIWDYTTNNSFCEYNKSNEQLTHTTA